MQIPYWLAAAALTGLPFAAAAQQQYQDPADVHAQIALPAYTSALSGYRIFAGPQEAPDRLWRSANREMQELGGHAGHMKQPAADPIPEARGGEAAAGHAHHHAEGH